MGSKWFERVRRTAKWDGVRSAEFDQYLTEHIGNFGFGSDRLRQPPMTSDGSDRAVRAGGYRKLSKDRSYDTPLQEFFNFPPPRRVKRTKQHFTAILAILSVPKAYRGVTRVYPAPSPTGCAEDEGVGVAHPPFDP